MGKWLPKNHITGNVIIENLNNFLNMAKRKIIILSCILFILILGSLFGISYYRKTKTQEKKEIIEDQWYNLASHNFKSLISQTEKKEFLFKPQIMINEVVDSPAAKDDIYFCSPRGINKYSLQDNRKELILSLYPCNNILWSPKGNRGYIISGTTTIFFDIETKEVKKLSKNIVNIIWYNDGNRVVYQYLNLFSKRNELYIADPKVENSEKIIDLEGEEEVNFLAWQGNDLYLTYGESTDLSSRLLWRINIAAKQKEELKEWEGNPSYIMSLEDNKLIFETLKINNEGKVYPMLYLVSEKGKKDLNLETFLNKCTKKNNSKILCGISENLYSIRSSDIIVEVDLETGDIVPLTKKDDKQSINVRNLFLSEDGDKLFFINNIDGRLWGLSLQ